MKRRDLLKLMALGGAGILTGLWSWRWSPVSPLSIVLLTDQPDQDVTRVLQFFKDKRHMRISEYPVQQTKQDITIITQHQLLDPTNPQAPRWVQHLAQQMRQRSTPAKYLITIEHRHPQPTKGQIIIESDGEVFDILSPTQSYRRIRVPGPAGDTYLALQDGKVTITQASCRHKVCQKADGTRKGRIICAPNRLIVTLPGIANLDALIG